MSNPRPPLRVQSQTWRQPFSAIRGRVSFLLLAAFLGIAGRITRRRLGLVPRVVYPRVKISSPTGFELNLAHTSNATAQDAARTTGALIICIERYLL